MNQHDFSDDRRYLDSQELSLCNQKVDCNWTISKNANANGGPRFYQELREITEFEDILLEKSFAPIPADWTIVITDVAGSTSAIEAGRYKVVNALGVASIIGIMNALPGVDIPFCFGGDGATLAVPTSTIKSVDCALRGLKQLAENKFQLKLRTGRISVKELQRAGHPISVAKFKSSSGQTMACFRGSGLTEAEDWIKSECRAGMYDTAPGDSAEVKLHGFECRWEPAHNQNGTICSILIKARQVDCGGDTLYSTAYSKVEACSSSALGPVTVNNLQLQGINSDFSIEAKILSNQSKGGWNYFKKLQEARISSLIGRLLCYLKINFGSFPGRTYLNDVAQNTDYRKFDEALRMVVDLSTKGADQLTRWLESQHQDGRLYYGIHHSKSALITCMIRSYENDHLHFVDGADGGYALAAKAMKAQMTRSVSGAV